MSQNNTATTPSPMAAGETEKAAEPRATRVTTKSADTAALAKIEPIFVDLTEDEKRRVLHWLTDKYLPKPPVFAGGQFSTLGSLPRNLDGCSLGWPGGPPPMPEARVAGPMISEER